MDVQRISIKFTKEPEKGTRFKVLQLLEFQSTKEQLDSINKYLSKLAKEQLNKKYQLEIRRYGEHLFINNETTGNKNVVFSDGVITKYPPTTREI